MTTGCECECMAGAGCTTFGSDLGIDGAVIGTGCSSGFKVRGEGVFLAVRVPIFSGLRRGGGEDGWR
jgi:hypothetical protein